MVKEREIDEIREALSDVEAGSLADYFPVEKDGKYFCPKCDVELLTLGWSTNIDRTGRGSEGFDLICPECDKDYYVPMVFRD